MSNVLHLQTLSSFGQTSEFDNLLASTTSTICPDGLTANSPFQSE